MFRKIIWYSLRSFKRQRIYIFINVAGLSIGIACSLFISFLIMNELSFDRFNVKQKRIFRVIQDNRYKEEYIAAYCPAVLGPAISGEIPEVESFLRMFRRNPEVVTYNNQAFNEEHLVEADSSFFNFFSIPVLKGDPGNLLNAPRKIVLSVSAAKKIFGDEDPLYKLVKIGSDTAGFTVSGIMGDIPANSHFEADMLLSFMTNPASNSQIWTNNSFSTYLLLMPNASYRKVDEKITELIFKHVGEEFQRTLNISLKDWIAGGHKYGYYLQRLADIHLDPSVQQEFKEARDPRYLKILACLGGLILLIASINFMNLSTAQSSRRAREVGIKKVSGSSRQMLFVQFLSESFVLSFTALVFALIILKITMPFLNNLIGSDVSPDFSFGWYTIPFLIMFTLVTGFLAGSYPALFLSSFSPAFVMKGGSKKNSSGGLLRKILVVIQFSASIFLIIGTIIMFRQIRYMLNKDPGFDKEQVIVIRNAETLGARIKTFREAAQRITGVVSIAGSTAVPGHNNYTTGFKLEGDHAEEKLMELNYIDYDFLTAYGMSIESGRNFEESGLNKQSACIINESAVRDFEITDPGNARLLGPGKAHMDNNMQVVGVVRNFQFRSLHNRITPYIFRLRPDDMTARYISVRLSPGNHSKTISLISDLWKEFTAENALPYYFIDDDLEKMYSREKQDAKIAVLFSVLAIFIAALGLFGLTSFTTDQRTKEIGVRKAMGSSAAEIYLVLSKDILVLLSVSSLISIPVIYSVANKWLENFYYRIDPGAFTFISGILTVLVVTILTISYRLIRAARVNPSDSLKYE